MTPEGSDLRLKEGNAGVAIGARTLLSRRSRIEAESHHSDCSCYRKECGNFQITHNASPWLAAAAAVEFRRSDFPRITLRKLISVRAHASNFLARMTLACSKTPLQQGSSAHSIFSCEIHLAVLYRKELITQPI